LHTEHRTGHESSKVGRKQRRADDEFLPTYPRPA
jgi:hypothetical protein